MIVYRPPMGFNTWNMFRDHPSAALLMETADVMKQEGLLDAGYRYIVLDDCWAEKERDQEGHISADHSKFPQGLKAVADYLHEKGFLFGMYTCLGNRTCGDYPASFGHEFQDVKDFADIGFDYLKYDGGFRSSAYPVSLLDVRMGTALRTCGREVVFAACNGGYDFKPFVDTDKQEHTWIASTGANMWRTTRDVLDDFDTISELISRQMAIQPYRAVNCYPDMDMLVVGLKGLSPLGPSGCSAEEYRTHFSCWAMFGSPLMIGCDVRSMDQDTKQILMNQEVIAVDQDAGSYAPFVIKNANDQGVQLLARFMENGDIVLLAVNFGSQSVKHWNGFFSFDSLGLGQSANTRYMVRDLWMHENIGQASEYLEIEGIPSHGCCMLRLHLVSD